MALLITAALMQLLGGAPAAAAHTSFSIDDVTVTEGNAGTTMAAFTISRSGPITGISAVQWSTANATATGGAPGSASDYGSLAATAVTFTAGQSQREVSVTINGDATYEGEAESFSVNLSNATGAIISDGSGLGVILNHDTGFAIIGTSKPEAKAAPITRPCRLRG